MDVEIEFLDNEEAGEAESDPRQRGEAQQKAGSKEAAAEEEEERDDEGPPFFASETSTFIPLTWSTPLPRTFYRGSDPEWSAFVQIARDKPRHRKLQDELVHIVYTGCVQHPSIARQLGKDAKVGKYWLDISFPDGPPPEFIRSGVELGDGYVAWSQQRVSAEKMWRWKRALWPTATAVSAWATCKVLAGIQYRRVKQAVGWGGSDPSSPEERYRHAMEGVAKREQRGAKVGKSAAAQTEPGGTPGAVVSANARSSAASAPDSSSHASAGPSDTSKKSPSSSSSSSSGLPWNISVPLPTPSITTTATTDLPIALHVFSATLSKNWNPKKSEPPRGTFVVQGLVEVRGARGRMLFDVQSSYDPKAGKYVQVNAGVRNFKRWNQAPRGGP